MGMSQDTSEFALRKQYKDVTAQRAVVGDGVLVYTLSENSTPEMIVSKKTVLMDLISTDCVVLINFTHDIEIETSYVALLVTVVRKLRKLGRGESLGLCVPNEKVSALLDSCRLMGNRTRKSKLFSNVFVTVDEAIQQMYQGAQPPYVLHINATKPDVVIHLGGCFRPDHGLSLLEMLGKLRPELDIPILVADEVSDPQRLGRLVQQSAASDDRRGVTCDIEADPCNDRLLLLRMQA
jgi:ABC-type transporter Mla MlaB component